MAVDNKPSASVFYSEMGVSIHETKGKLRGAVKCGFGSRVHDRTAYARTEPLTRHPEVRAKRASKDAPHVPAAILRDARKSALLRMTVPR
jgi:hypothetical protein